MTSPPDLVETRSTTSPSPGAGALRLHHRVHRPDARNPPIPLPKAGAALLRAGGGDGRHRMGDAGAAPCHRDERFAFRPVVRIGGGPTRPSRFDDRRLGGPSSASCRRCAPTAASTEAGPGEGSCGAASPWRWPPSPCRTPRRLIRPGSRLSPLQSSPRSAGSAPRPRVTDGSDHRGDGAHRCPAVDGAACAGGRGGMGRLRPVPGTAPAGALAKAS